MVTSMSTKSLAGLTLLVLAHWDLAVYAQANDNYTCTKAKGCKIGCYGPLDNKGSGVCGLGPKFCGDGCTSTCEYKSECDPGWGPKWSNARECPLSSRKYQQRMLSGTTADFCGNKTVTAPEYGGRSSDAKTIGYYEGWNLQRPCGTMQPEDIPLGYYTHKNFAFALIDLKSFRIAPMDADTASLYRRVTALKGRQKDLQVWIAIGGWAMNDPGATRTIFSDLAKSESAQDAFFESLVTFMLANNFDGVDIDWEYPVAGDRGGISEDFDNYATLLQRLRSRFNAIGRPYGMSITLPASYWYLKGFNIVAIEPYVDWFNVMTYDIHGVWDSTVQSLSTHAYTHTNLTEINLALKLLWRNNIDPGRVVMGLGFYGRSFTMKDANCLAPGCPFSEGARGGDCTGTPGVLSAAEIQKVIDNGAKVTFDAAAAVQIVTWDSDQWVSWDDVKTLMLKVDYANRRCLGGTMIWAIDLDDGTLIDSLGANMGRSKKRVPPEPRLLGQDLGNAWPDEL